MNARKIRITDNDRKNLREAIREAENSGYRSSVYIQELNGELERVDVVAPDKIPADVITMNSRVVITSLEDNSRLELTLVYPADAQGKGKVSILAPIGTSILGYRVGDVFEWDTPAGKASLRVDEILYQPESAGVYDKSGYLSRVRSTAPEYYFIKAPINCGALLLLANALSE